MSGMISGAARRVAATLAAATGAALVGWKQTGAGAAARTLQDKARELVSVRDFGAVGDGAADDTAAFDAATAYIKSITLPSGRTAATLWVPRGIYNIDRILITHSDFRLECEPGTMFKWRGGASSTYPYFIYPDNLPSVNFSEFYKDFVIAGVRIDPATIASGKSAIRIGNMYQGVIRDCHIEDDTFGTDATKLALDFGNGSYKWSVENCTFPRMRCAATSAWNVTTIAFRSVGGRRLILTNALGITCHGLVLEGDEASDKVTIDNCRSITISGGDFEGAGAMYRFTGTNSNFHSWGNDTTALTGVYTSGATPVNSYFNDRGTAGFGYPNLDGTAAHHLIRRVGAGKVLRLDTDGSGNIRFEVDGNGYVFVGPEDDRLCRLVAATNGANASLSWQDGKLGFYTASPIARPVVTGAKGGNAALTSLVAALASLGLITNSTTT